MPSILSNTPFLVGACLWSVLTIIWLAGLTKNSKAHWMHRLHALLPFVAIVLYMALPAGTEASRMVQGWLLAGMSIIVILTPVWLTTLVTRNSGVMDVFYTPTASLTAVALLVADGHYALRQVVCVVFIVLWSSRLVHHAWGTNMGAGGEQQPYAKWRIIFGRRWWWWSYFQVFLLQGGLVWVWMLPVVFAIRATPGPLTILDMVAALVWLTGFVFQAGADWQLKRFKANPANKGQVLQTGFWSLSRHPNYFGEAVMWWAYFVFGLASPYGWLGVVGPVYVTWFMSKGSATPMLDRHMLKTKPGYADYVARVPGFVPFIRR